MREITQRDKLRFDQFVGRISAWEESVGNKGATRKSWSSKSPAHKGPSVRGCLLRSMIGFQRLGFTRLRCVLGVGVAEPVQTWTSEPEPSASSSSYPALFVCCCWLDPALLPLAAQPSGFVYVLHCHTKHKSTEGPRACACLYLNLYVFMYFYWTGE